VKKIRQEVAGPLGFEPRTSGSAGQCHNPSARKKPMILDLPVVLDYGPAYEDYNKRIIKTLQQMAADGRKRSTIKSCRTDTQKTLSLVKTSIKLSATKEKKRMRG
jgi:hypothetical protein